MSDVLMVLIVVIGIVVSIASKKNKGSAQRQRQAAQGRETVDPKPVSRQGVPSRPSPARTSAAPSPYPSSGPSKFPTAAPANRTVAQQRQQSKPATPEYGGTPRYTHVVTSTLEGGHTHTESSITGEEACPPPQTVPNKQPETGKSPAESSTGTLLSFQTNSVLQGVLYAEILGKPRALQRH